MKGEGTCSKVPEHAYHYPGHCVHPRPRKGDLICCFCGDLFEPEEPVPGPHGQYARNKDAKET